MRGVDRALRALLLVVCGAVNAEAQNEPPKNGAPPIGPWRLPTTDPLRLPPELRDAIRDGASIWVATSHGVIRIATDGSRMRSYTNADGLVSDLIHKLLKDSRGRIWVGAVGKGVSYFSGGASEPTTLTPTEEAVIDTYVMHEDEQGRVWFGGVTEPYWIDPRGAALHPLKRASGEPIYSWGTEKIFDTTQGVVIGGTAGHWFVVGPDGIGRRIASLLPEALRKELPERENDLVAPLPPRDDKVPIRDVLRSKNGDLWIATQFGILSCRGGFETAQEDKTWKWPDQGSAYRIFETNDGILTCESSVGFFFRRPFDTSWTELLDPQGGHLRDVWSTVIEDKLLIHQGQSPTSFLFTPQSENRIKALSQEEWQQLYQKQTEASGIKFSEKGRLLLKTGPADDWKAVASALDLLPGNFWESNRYTLAIDPSKSDDLLGYPAENYLNRRFAVLGVRGMKIRHGTWRRKASISNGYGPIHISVQGSVWDRNSRVGLTGYTKDGKSHWRTNLDSVLAVLEDSKGNVWVSTRDGLQRGDWESRQLKSEPLGSGLGSIEAIYESPKEPGTIWLGTSLGRVRALSGGTQNTLEEHPLFNEPKPKIDRSVAPAGGPVASPSPEVAPAPVASPIEFHSLDEDDRSVVSIHQGAEVLWVGLRAAVLAYRRVDDAWLPDLNRSWWLKTADLVSIHEDRAGRLWLKRQPDREGGPTIPKNTLSVYEPPRREPLPFTPPPSFATFPDDSPDDSGAIWIARDSGVARLSWNGSGVPGRLDQQYFTSHRRWLGAVSRWGDAGWALWRTRLTGLLRSTETEATPFAVDTAYPVNVMAPAIDGGVWAGYPIHGLAKWNSSGRQAHWGVDEGLPSASVLDISSIPADAEARAWVGTNDGAALVTPNAKAVAVSIPDSPGPVDVVVALTDGNAYAAFNAIPASLFLTTSPELIEARRKSHLRLIKSNGSSGTAIQLDRGDVLDMALDSDGKTVWIGTTAGLYKLDDGKLVKIDASGRLGNVPIRVLTVAEDGAIWMGVDRQSEDAPAEIIGYTPKLNDIKIMNAAMGLPESDRIEMVELLPDGRLAAFASGKLLRSRDPVVVRIPPPLWPWIVGGALVLFVSTGVATGIGRHLSHRREIAYHAKSISAAEAFFSKIGRRTRRRDYRTLQLLDSAPHEPAESGPPLVHCLPSAVDTDQVTEIAQKLPKAPDGKHVLCYLFSERELEPAARWQLDTLRLREHKVIIPMTAAYVGRALDQGQNKAKAALESLVRRYLAQQDLFDMRNALDEPRFFFGRKTFIDEIAQALGRREHVALIGQRKVGKTSVLNVLSQQLDTFPIVVIDLEIYSRDEDWPTKLLTQIVDRYDAWGKARFGERWSPSEMLGAEVTGTDFESVIRERHQLRIAFGSDTPLCVVLDEIERLFPERKPKHEESEAEQANRREQAKRFIEGMGILRALGQQQAERLFCLIVADRERRFNRVNHFDVEDVDTNPLYMLFVEKIVSPLRSEDCNEMLTALGHAMGIEVTSEMAEAVHRDSGGHPRFARLLASAAYQRRGRSVTLGLEEYERGLTWLRDDNGGVDDFVRENIWRHVSDAERVLLGRASSDEGIDNEVLLNTDGLRDITASELKEARQSLTTTEILEKCGERLRVRGDLIRAWIRENS